ncbi:hypothetical protein HPB52_021033 [Rhipicephalus sanguineus]|uniref:CCHC-type domain-containing protein n=1 Tax=Rhipicephalus sanguineus TaxID=34632 RepID=A0A9D4QAR6_RHISA|nr:hypothetical protein HPB52_021033 [Rhipicephalus sanguineus]
MATATVVTGYDPTSMQVLTMETSSADYVMPSENEYLEDMVNTWKRKKAKSKPASLPQDAATARRPTDAACTSAPSPPAKQRKCRPRQTPRLSRDDYIVVLKPRVPCELRTSVPADRVGDAIRAYLGDQTTAQVQVWPIWDQNIIVCSTTELPKAQKLLGDFQLPVGDQQLPVRGHAKPSGETCRGVITINPAETSQKIKSELHWPQGTILAARKLGDSAAAVVTFEGTKLPRFLFYHCVATYVRPYKKTVPACTRCGTIGHRPSVCPHPNPDRCAKCGTLAAEGLTDHDCHPKCLLCQGAHETGAIGCTGKYRMFTPTSTPSPGPTPSPLHNKGARPKQPGSARPADTQEFPPLAASTAPLQVSGWAGVAAPGPLFPPPAAPPSPELAVLRKQNADLQRKIALLTKQVASLQQGTPQVPGPTVPAQTAPPATSPKLSPQAAPTSNTPTPSVATASFPVASLAPGAPQAPVPIDPTLSIEERVPRLENLLLHHISTFSVQRIVTEVVQAIQAWAITQFKPKTSRSRSPSESSIGSAPRRRKVASGTSTPGNSVSIPLPVSQSSEQDMAEGI